MSVGPPEPRKISPRPALTRAVQKRPVIRYTYDHVTNMYTIDHVSLLELLLRAKGETK